MANVLITGGTGMIGQRLTTILINNGYTVTLLTRKVPVQQPMKDVTYALWDFVSGYIDKDAIANADYVIHLAGAGVADERWTEQRKKIISDSRTKSGQLLVDTLSTTNNQVKAVISASAIGWYGPDTEQSCSNGFIEKSVANSDFLGKTCVDWEKSVQPFKGLGKRLAIIRIGIVLSNTGGALVEFRKPLVGGVAAILGSGEQMISWIHLDDLCNLFLYVLENKKLEGVFNAVADNPVTNKELTLTLAKLMRGRWFLPIHVPEFLLKLILGEMSIEVLKSTTVSNQKIKETGFEFTYPTIQPALDNLLQQRS